MMRGLSLLAKYSLRYGNHAHMSFLGVRAVTNLPFKSPSPASHSSEPNTSGSDNDSTSGSKSSSSTDKGVDYFEDYLVFSVRVIVLLGVITGFFQNSKLLKQCGEDGNEIQRLESSMEQITSEICHENFRNQIIEEEKQGSGERVLEKALKELLKKYPQVEEEEQQQEGVVSAGVQSK
jgi:hypothetical protein